MKMVRVDSDGNLRYWNCGSTTFTSKRTARSKVLVGVGALATKKKLKCQLCGDYNDQPGKIGNAKPFREPANKRLAKKYGTWSPDETAVEPPLEPSDDPPEEISPQTVTGELATLAQLHDEGALSDEEFESAKRQLLNDLPPSEGTPLTPPESNLEDE